VCERCCGAVDLPHSFVLQYMEDVVRLRKRTEEALLWLSKIKAGMKPKEWGDFNAWFVGDSKNQSVFLKLHEQEKTGPLVYPPVVPDDPLHARIADVITLFLQRKR
jgi:hypothetical protein